ncbi:hypothetical protein PMAYCL1PPCAC_29860, partial [Pristionchus mayeri]
MPKPSNYWSKNRRVGGNNHHGGSQGAGGNHHNGEKGGGRELVNHPSNHGTNHPSGREGGGGGNTNQQGTAQNKKSTPCVRSRSELRRILHDKLEWNEKTAALDLTLLVCADERD